MTKNNETCWRKGCESTDAVRRITNQSGDVTNSCSAHIAGAATLGDAVTEMRRAWTEWATAK